MSNLDNNTDRIRLLRLAVGLSILAAIAIVALISNESDHFQVCERRQTNAVEVSKSCRPLTFHDPAVVFAAVVATIVLTPEIGALRIPGVVSLEPKPASCRTCDDRNRRKRK